MFERGIKKCIFDLQIASEFFLKYLDQTFLILSSN